MLRDPTALLNIQIAFMGIVLVVGLFYLWKMMKGIDNKMHKLSATVAKLQEQMEAPRPMPVMSGPSAEEDAAAQAFMNEVFGGAGAPMFLHPFAAGAHAPSSVVIEEDVTPSADDEQVAAPAAQPGPVVAAEDDVDSHSVGTAATASHISKSKVRKMSADALRELCKERGLETEGNRAALMERILATLDD